uniref:Uncharacterized protein n=1 Tax=Chlamydomonas leiostraca TaxID=1034604 RepID=A0A7S0RN15_9CHLO|mmetsp:Transcript_27222/g.69321  ORF Transcript_27222/g.69321 Transcript_27222/m.69321 type:complete len:115 (+) Transcript_27222:46-390(+)
MRAIAARLPSSSTGVAARTRPSRQVQRAPCRQFTQHRLPAAACRALTPEEEREIERMKQEASQGGLLESELVASVLKVGIVALAVAVTVLLLDAAEPVIDTTIAVFPRGGAPAQ